MLGSKVWGIYLSYTLLSNAVFINTEPLDEKILKYHKSTFYYLLGAINILL